MSRENRTGERWKAYVAEYGLALLKHVKAFASGSIVSVALQFVAAYGTTLPFWSYLLAILGGGLFSAGFFVWLDEKVEHGDELAGLETAHSLRLLDVQQTHSKEIANNDREHSVAVESLRWIHAAELARMIDSKNEELAAVKGELAAVKTRLEERAHPVLYFHSKDCVERTHGSQKLLIKVTNEGGKPAHVTGLTLDHVKIDGQERSFDRNSSFLLAGPDATSTCDISPGASRHYAIIYQAGSNASHGAMNEFSAKGIEHEKFSASTLEITLRLHAEFADQPKMFRFEASPRGTSEWGFLKHVEPQYRAT